MHEPGSIVTAIALRPKGYLFIVRFVFREPGKGHCQQQPFTVTVRPSRTRCTYSSNHVCAKCQSATAA